MNALLPRVQRNQNIFWGFFMNYWDAKKIRYIKLGQKGSWSNECFSKQIIRLGFATNLEHIMDKSIQGDWNYVKEYWSEDGRSGNPTSHTNQMREFFSDDGQTLWVTFENNCLYYGFSNGGDPLTHIDGRGAYRTMQPDGWQNINAKGETLSIDSLSGALTKTSAYRGTICAFTPEMEQYLRLKLQGIYSDKVESAISSRQKLVCSIIDIVKSLTWQDFELLVELIFANSGMQRLSATGGGQKTIDISLQNRITNETFFVQVKSETSQYQLDDYISKKISDSSGYSKMYYVYHTSLGLIESNYEDIIIWNADDIANQIVANGLIDWVISKAK
jgi:hypothetical protein